MNIVGVIVGVSLFVLLAIIIIVDRVMRGLRDIEEKRNQRLVYEKLLK